MKILFVDLKYHYGIKLRGINQIGIDGFQHSLIELGHEVIPYYYDDFVTNTAPLQEKLIAMARTTRPDLIFFSLFEDQFSTQTLATLKSEFVTLNWFGDDTWRFESFTQKYAPHFTHCVTTDRLALEKYKTHNIDSVLLSQWAAPYSSEACVSSQPKKYKYDISFIGGTQSYRRWFISYLQKHGITVNCFGNGWKNGSLSTEEMADIFLTSKINLNISNSISYDLRYICHSLRAFVDVVRGKKSGTQIKARSFEINYFGGFQLTEYVSGLEEYYSIGEDLVCYQNIDEAIPLIKHYLANESKRETICTTGQRKAIAQHSYYHRLAEIITQLNINHKPVS